MYSEIDESVFANQGGRGGEYDFACRIFRGQEGFLRRQRERKADPRLETVELEGNHDVKGPVMR